MHTKNLYSSLSTLAILVLLFNACGTPQATLTPGPPAGTGSPGSEVTQPADIIFHNGTIITIDHAQPLSEALAIRAGRIQTVGTNDEVLALQGADTVIVDLHGYTMMPGFVEGHTHYVRRSLQAGKPLQEIMDAMLSFGLTSETEMHGSPDFVESMLQAEQNGELRVRVNIFSDYNYGFLENGKTIIEPHPWYLDHEPILDTERMLRTPGVKIFADGAGTQDRGCPYYSFSLEEINTESWSDVWNVCGSEYGDLYLSEAQLTEAIQSIQDHGYRAAFHAMGDGTIDAILNALETVLGGESNSKYRHQIQHNSLLRPDQIERYAQMDILASVNGHFNTCDAAGYVDYFGESHYEWAANRYALPGLGIHAYGETDIGPAAVAKYKVPPNLNPLTNLFGLVTHQQPREDGSTCQPPEWISKHQISVERALEMLTIEAAYAVSMEEAIGSVEPGKYADLIILSGNPLTVDPNKFLDLKVWMTMVAGKVEYCAPGQEAFCPAAQPAASTPATTAQIVTPTPLPGTTVLSVDTLVKSIPWLPVENTARPSTYYFYFNLSKPPFNNLLARQAFAAAIDRDALAVIAKGYGIKNPRAATTLTPPEILGRDLYNQVGIPFNPTQAKDLLAQAGYTEASPFPPVTLLTAAGSDAASSLHVKIADAIVQMWQQYLGVKVAVETIRPGAYQERIKSNPPEVFRLAWVADYNDPDDFLREIFHSGSQYNYGKFSNPEFDQLVDRAAKATDPAERQELYILAERLLCETEAVLIPIYHSTYNAP